MYSQFQFRKIAVVLFSIVLILLIANLIFSKLLDNGEKPKDRKEISGMEIDKIFHTALKNYGLSDDWITKKKNKSAAKDSLFSTYSIRLPKSVPAELILLELQDLFWNYNVDLKSEELSKPEKVLLNIISDKFAKLNAEFITDDKIYRKYATLSFLVYNLPTDNAEILNKLLNIPELYYIVISPSENSKKILGDFIKSNKRYTVLLDDNITDLNFKLNPKYSEDRLKRSIREIVGTFPNAAFYIVDNKSDIYESTKYKFIENEFRKRNIRMFPKNQFVLLDGNNLNIESKFQDLMMRLSKVDEKVLFVTTDEFLTISNILPLYRKIGYKFIYPGELVLKK
jgi:hypothetical protein